MSLDLILLAETPYPFLKRLAFNTNVKVTLAIPGAFYLNYLV